MQTSLLRLLQCDFHDLLGNAFDLDIHLQGSDTVGCTSYFKVHVAEVIFVAEDVSQNGETLAFLDQTHGDTGNRRLQRHTRVHQRQAAYAD